MAAVQTSTRQVNRMPRLLRRGRRAGDASRTPPWRSVLSSMTAKLGAGRWKPRLLDQVFEQSDEALIGTLPSSFPFLDGRRIYSESLGELDLGQPEELPGS